MDAPLSSDASAETKIWPAASSSDVPVVNLKVPDACEELPVSNCAAPDPTPESEVLIVTEPLVACVLVPEIAFTLPPSIVVPAPACTRMLPLSLSLFPVTIETDPPSFVLLLDA